jgi:hypothetical protein
MNGLIRVRRVAVVEDQVVAVGVGEEGHVADAGVDRLAVELHALAFQLLPRGRDVVDVQRRRGVFLRRELEAPFRRLPDAEAGLADPKLVVAVLVGAQAQGLST